MAKRVDGSSEHLKYLEFCLFGAKDHLLDEDNGRGRWGAAAIRSAREGARASAGVRCRARIGTIDHPTIHRLYRA